MTTILGLIKFHQLYPPSNLPSSLPQRDLAALEKKVNVLSQESQRLSKTYPDSAALMREREREVATAWKALLTKSHARNSKLVEAEQLQRYFNDFRDLRCAVCICDVMCVCVQCTI